MLSFNPLVDVDIMIEELEKKLVKVRALKETLSSMSLYEVGIRKTDNQVFFLKYSISVSGNLHIEAHYLPPSSMSPVYVDVDVFKRDYVPYSVKARSILPKKD